MTTKLFDPYDFSKKEINGVPIYYKNLPWAPCIHIRVLFKTGAFDDPPGKEGLSHFLEHMIFNGSPTLPDKKAIREWSKLHALSTWNAGTSPDRTCYRLKCLPEEYNAVLSGIKDMIFDPYLRAEDVEHERKIITQEAWGRFKNEKLLKYIKKYIENLFHGHDHERLGSPLGWPDTIAKISAEDIRSWHKNNYGTGNFFIVITGAVNEEHIKDLKIFLKDLPGANKTIKNKESLGKPTQKKIVKTADEIGDVKEQTEISVVRVAKNIPYTENEICSLFGKLIYDVLNERLRIEHSICYGVSAGIGRYKTFSQFSISIKTEEKNIELVEKEFENVAKEIMDKKYVERFNVIKKLYLDQLRSSEMLSGNIADNTTEEIADYEGHIIKLKEQLSDIEKVEYKDIIKLTKWAFDPEYLFTEIILPSKK